MIGGPNPITHLLSSIYSANDQAIADSLARIASGKRIQAPGDDYAGYARVSDLQSDVTLYLQIKQDLQDAQGAVDYAVGVGNAVLDDLTRLRELQDLHAAAAGDTDKQDAYSAEYDAIVNRVSETVANSAYDGIAVYGTSSVASAGTIDATATNAANSGALSAGGVDGTDDIDTQLIAAQAYVADMSSWQTGISREMKLNDIIIAGKNATISAITDINEVEELSALTLLQVRQEATAAMLAQGNIIQGYAAQLYGGSE